MFFSQSQLEQAQSTNSQLMDQNILLKAQLQAASDLQKTQQQQQSPFHLLPTQGEQTNHQIELLEAQLSTLTLQQQESHSKTTYLEAENRRLLGEVESLKQRVNEAERGEAEAKGDLEKLRRDQEDLLELLTDQESKLGNYRQLLKKLGHKLEDDSDEDEPENGEGENIPLQ